MARYYRNSTSLVALLLFVLITLPDCSSSRPKTGYPTQADAWVSKELKTRCAANVAKVRTEALSSAKAVRHFYERRGYRPMWIDLNGPYAEVPALIEMIQSSERHGLNPAEYHAPALAILHKELLQQDHTQVKLTSLLTDFDLLLTDAFFVLATHLNGGRLNPSSIVDEWNLSRPKLKLAQLLEESKKKKIVVKVLQKLAPQDAAYERLMVALESYKKIKKSGGWPHVADGALLKPGETNPRVVQLRNRLMPAADPKAVVSDKYDDKLADEVRKFQTANYLATTGIVDSKTVAELNVSIQKRIEQLQVNLERWRWFPRELGDRYMLVDIAGFRLDVMENGKSQLNMRVVVGSGKDDARTPVFSKVVTHVVVNPAWHVPQKIATKEYLPKLRRDLSYFTKRKFKIFKMEGKEKTEVALEDVDWSSVKDDDFDYHLQQEPGPSNALGSIKFLFPNPYAVYLHGTPEQKLFSRDVRNFSHGCIRVEKPLVLAKHLLKDDPIWNDKKLKKEMSEGDEAHIKLRAPMDIHLFYWTAYAPEQGPVQFRRDIYQWDTPVLTALRSEKATTIAAE